MNAETQDGTLNPDAKEPANDEKKLTGSLSDLVKIRRHFLNLIIMACLWMSFSFDYYLVNF